MCRRNSSACVSRSVVSDSATPWTVACQAPLSMAFSRQGYWSGLPFPSPSISRGSSRRREQTCVGSLLHCRQILDCLSHQGSPRWSLLKMPVPGTPSVHLHLEDPMGPVVPMAMASVDSTASCRSVLLCMFVCVTEELGRDAETPEQEENGNYFSKKYNPPISS